MYRGVAFIVLLSMLGCCLAGSSCSLVGTWEGSINTEYNLFLTLGANGTAEVTSKWTTTCDEESAVQNQCTTYLEGTYTTTPTVIFVDLQCAGGAGGDCCPCEGGLTMPLSYGDWSADCDEVTVGIFGYDVLFHRQ